VETNQFNSLTYSAAYDGDGELVYESSVTNPGTTQTSYIVGSTVLGDVLTRLDQAGNKKITHVPAEGLLFATQRTDGPGAFVLFTQRNPLGISETTKAVYDPLGNYIPFQASGDPRPPAGSFSSASMGGLSSSQANPFSYAVGCMFDGVPTTCNKVVHAINNGQAKTLQIDGRQNSNVLLANTGIFLVEYPTDNTKPTRPFWRPYKPNPKPGNPDPYNVGRDEHTWGLALVSFEDPQDPTQKPLDPSQMLQLLTGECVHFLNTILAELGKEHRPYSNNFPSIFRKAGNRISTRQMTPNELKKGWGGTYSTVGDPAFYIFIDEGQYNWGAYQGGYILIHELFHAAGSSLQYDHTQMANAAYNAAKSNPVLWKELVRHGIENKKPRVVDYTPGKYVEADDWFNASVFDFIIRYGCPKPSQ
jgi:hypothetical protein